MLRRLLDAMSERRLRGVDVESVDRVYRQRDILRRKPLIQAVMGEFYSECRALDEAHFSGSGLRVELGAGSSLMKEFQPDVLVTDLEAADFHDRVLDAEAMDLPDACVRAFYAINCFHHFTSPRRFFSELSRTLVPGGGCVLIEPYHGPLAAFLYRRLFDTESYEPRRAGWEGEADHGLMKGANQALSFIVFRRDRAEFERQHPCLELVAERRSRTYLRYLLSGGLNFRQLVPTRAGPWLSALERMLTPVEHLFALHHLVVLRKRA